LAKLVYEELKAAISDGRLSPGAPLSEEDLASELGVSRTPLREALVQLEGDGLVESIAFKGRFVRPITRQEHLDINQAYEALQTYAVRTAATAIPDEEILRVEAVFEEVAEAIQSGDIEAHFRTDRAIHRLITHYGNNAVIERLVETLMLHMFRYYTHFGPNLGRDHIVKAFEEHSAILEALKKHDGELAERLVREHFRKAAERTKGLFPMDSDTSSC